MFKVSFKFDKMYVMYDYTLNELRMQFDEIVKIFEQHTVRFLVVCISSHGDNNLKCLKDTMFALFKSLEQIVHS